jgi:type II secretion system protein N
MKIFRRKQPSGEPAVAGRPRRRRSHLILGALGCGLLGFLVGTYLFFPVAALRDRLTAEVAARSTVQLQIANLALHFPLGLAARGVEVTTAELPSPLDIEHLQLTPRWLSLFGPDPGVDLEATLLGGSLAAEYHRSGAFVAQGDHLALDLPLGNLKSLGITATVREATVSSAAPLRPGTASQAQVVLENLQLHGLKAVGGAKDDLHLGTVTLKASGQGNNFRVEELSATGGDLNLNGSGSLLLSNSPRTSRLNLNATLKPATTFDPALSGLLEMFAKPAADGSLHLRLTGSLAAPNLK